MRAGEQDGSGCLPMAPGCRSKRGERANSLEKQLSAPPFVLPPNEVPVSEPGVRLIAVAEISPAETTADVTGSVSGSRQGSSSAVSGGQPPGRDAPRCPVAKHPGTSRSKG